LIHNRQVKTITLAGCRIFNDEWDKKLQTALYSDENPHRAAYLLEVETRINHETDAVRSFILKLEKEGRYTLGDLVGLYNLKTDDGKLPGYAGGLARAPEERGQRCTARAYRTAARGLVTFNKGRDIP
jgi:hypothetical protein